MTVVLTVAVAMGATHGKSAVAITKEFITTVNITAEKAAAIVGAVLKVS